MRLALLILTVVALGGCALSHQGAGAADPPPSGPTTQQHAGVPDAPARDPKKTGPSKPKNGETPAPANGETPDPGNGEPAEQPTAKPSDQPPIPGISPTAPSPWTPFTRVRNGFASNIDFNQSSTDTYGGALITGIGYEGDDVEFSYEIAGHSYTNSNRWDRLSQVFNAAYEMPFGRKWDLELQGTVGFKGTSEDRDIVDRDFELSPRFEYLFTPQHRLRLYSKHRLKYYDEAPETNAFKNYVGVEYLEFVGPRRYFEFGARYETNDEVRDRSDSIRWTYSVQHVLPLSTRDSLVLNVRYRLKRYPRRFVEVEDEDVLRVDHRWSPAIAWVRTVGKVDLSFDYAYETTYSNDPEKAYKAHMAFSSVGYRWR